MAARKTKKTPSYLRTAIVYRTYVRDSPIGLCPGADYVTQVSADEWHLHLVGPFTRPRSYPTEARARAAFEALPSRDFEAVTVAKYVALQTGAIR